ncbi:hypothetical protein Poli38472_004238 [Pythium oligandrum]|uniref:Uncharacterized protein n=1 Tax=Pythium oligandrum TaxID=41045 RepID=A0A8K1CQE8_PYTOL|nr:hypothetical protein Poli38472_004238 [Pythium oligandrum]|eukprot:TMW66473.1 hypothetical protein Poli38472_004238 [Pythium oligandrum]
MAMPMETIGDDWAAIEDQLEAATLSAVPPTSDPERLLRYVLNILPKYTEMEMMVTHLRLYATSLEQDLAQSKQHTRILSTEVAHEREKKQFLERYAAQIVKERNELLHHRASKKSKTASSAHFTWHSCCKKSGSHSLDVTPSINAFRGEKLQEMMTQMKTLQEEVRNQERLREEMNFLLKKTQREHDSKVVSDRKHIQQLEKQLVQRSMLQSSLERKVYEVESALARYDSLKREEMKSLESELEQAKKRVDELDTSLKSVSESEAGLREERERLQDQLEHANMLKNELVDQVEGLQSELTTAQIQVESLQSEVSVLQSEDVAMMKNLYMKKMQQLQEEAANREQELMLQVDNLRRELKTNESRFQQAFQEKAHNDKLEDEDKRTSQGSSLFASRARKSESKWKSGSSHVSVNDLVGSSLSRSQLSETVVSMPLNRSTLYPDDTQLDAAEEDLVFDDADSVEGSDTETKFDEQVDAYIQEYISSHSRVSSRSQHEAHWDEPNSEFADEVSLADSVARAALEPESPSEGDASHESSDVASEQATDLFGDLKAMLHGFEQRRLQEEQKAAMAEKALVDFQESCDDFRKQHMSLTS